MLVDVLTSRRQSSPRREPGPVGSLAWRPAGMPPDFRPERPGRNRCSRVRASPRRR